MGRYFIYIIFYVSTLFSWMPEDIDTNLYAVVNVPVLDASGLKLNKYSMMEIAASWSPHTCNRMHQFLFNEVVKVIDIYDDQVKIEALSNFYMTPDGKKKSIYFVKKAGLDFIDFKNKKLKFIPTPLDKNNIDIEDFSVLSLEVPWTDDSTGLTFSAGTRFKTIEKLHKARSYAITYYDFKDAKSIVSYIPKHLVNINKKIDIETKIKKFISILKKWADRTHGFIPYVQGGASFVKRYSDIKFYETPKDNSFWFRPEIEERPFVGMECSSMILRAAQIAGLSFFLRNTITMKNLMPQIKSTDIVENGDIVWHEGHVLVVSDVKNGLILESAGYPTGYGMLHETKLENVFDKISNYNDLKKVSLSFSPVKRLKENGEYRKYVNPIILKLKKFLS